MATAQKILDKETEIIIQKVKEDIAGYYNRYTLDMDAICKENDIHLLETEFDDPNVIGALTKDNGSWSIVVNSNDPAVRRRFTVAHELGHYFAFKYESEVAKDFLEDNNGVIKDYFVVNRSEMSKEDVAYQAERQANMIAASILMPEDMVKSLFDEGNDVTVMAEKFGVSESAMSYRLKSLKYDTLETRYS